MALLINETGDDAVQMTDGAIHVTGVIAQATTVNEQTVTLTSANTEYSLAFPANTKRFSFNNKGGNDTRYAFATGKVAGSVEAFGVLPGGMTEFEDGLNLSTTLTVYFASASAGDKVYVRWWT